MEDNTAAITAGLDEAQYRAVTSIDGPVLIVAGAGAGKTRVLTSRIAYALAKGCAPERILALTFTKKAAAEMKERIGLMVGEKKARKLYMGTFHSVFIRFLREYADRLGYPSSFTVYDTSDSTSAIKRCIKTLALDEKTYKPRLVLSRISSAKNDLWTSASYKRDRTRIQDDIRMKIPRLCDLYEAYQGEMKKAGVMDFDDILLNMNILLKTCPEALEDISGRFDYILVDEYQDTNYSQYLILKRLSAPHNNICVVGDDSQSIYAFRGARIENILNFSRDYPGYRLFKLERNYRSTGVIVDAANSVIAHNHGRIPKECRSMAGSGDRIRLIRAYTDREEALLVASSIVSRMSSDHAEYRDFAILYRTNSQSKALEEALRNKNLPYRIYAGNAFFDRAEIRDMMAYLKLVVNNRDNESFRRIVNVPARGIGDTTVDNLSKAAADAGCSLFEAISLEGLELFGLKAATLSRLRAFRDMVLKAASAMGSEDAYKVAVSINDSCGLYAAHRSDLSVEGQSRAANIEELMNSVKDFVDRKENEYREELIAGEESDSPDGAGISALPLVTLADFLEEISLLSSVDMEEEGEEDVNNRISLMTVHSSKGLEFPYVFVVGMEDGLFPSEQMSGRTDVEEERRLFYVAVTRARTALCLSFCRSRMKNGQTKEFPVSRFVREISPEYIENPLREGENGSFCPGISVSVRPVRGRESGQRQGTEHGGNRYGGTAGRPSGTAARPLPAVSARRAESRPEDFVPVPVLDLRAGMHIEHNRFGKGVIVEISGNPADLRARIDFDAYGEKILILKYAKIRLA